MVVWDDHSREPTGSQHAIKQLRSRKIEWPAKCGERYDATMQLLGQRSTYGPRIAWSLGGTQSRGQSSPSASDGPRSGSADQSASPCGA
jgi:hypothetical protein